MEANELRIGNLVLEKDTETKLKIIGIFKLDSEEFEADTLTFEGIANRQGDVPISALKSIELSKEWLLNFGLKEIPFPANSIDNKRTTETVYFHIHERWINLRMNENSFHLCFDFDNRIMDITEIKYVHQLQNLHFILTGVELKYLNM